MTFLVCPCLVCLWMLEEGLVVLDVGRGKEGRMGVTAPSVGGGEGWGKHREVLTALNVGEGKGRDGGWGLLLQIG